MYKNVAYRFLFLFALLCGTISKGSATAVRDTLFDSFAVELPEGMMQSEGLERATIFMSIINPANSNCSAFIYKPKSEEDTKLKPTDCWMIISHQIAGQGSYPCCDDIHILDKQEQDNMISIVQQDRNNNFRLLSTPFVHTIHIGSAFANELLCKREYEKNKPLMVRYYHFYNSEEYVTIVISYPEVGSPIQPQLFDRMIQSFAWKKSNYLSQKKSNLSEPDGTEDYIYKGVYLLLAVVCCLVIWLRRRKKKKEEKLWHQEDEARRKELLLEKKRREEEQQRLQSQLAVINEQNEQETFVLQPAEEQPELVESEQDLELLRVNYQLNNPDTDGTYVSVHYPQQGTLVWPHRYLKSGRRGYSVEMFREQLFHYLSDRYELSGEVSLHLVDGARAYEPDIAIIDTVSGKNIRVDIEIDEPYAGYSKYPLHSKDDATDKLRDEALASRGWIVIRFAEVQAVKQAKMCAAFIAHILQRIDADFPIADTLKDLPEPNKINRWTKVDINRMINGKERERYLYFYDFKPDLSVKAEINILKLNDEERRYLAALQPLQEYDTKDRDSLVRYDAERNVYLYDNAIAFISVDTFIDNSFPTFDIEAAAKEKSLAEGLSYQQVMDEWICKREVSRQTDAFLNKQIASKLLGDVSEACFHFSYHSTTNNCEEDLSIEKELSLFQNFMDDYIINPCRVEMPIYDGRFSIAGTPNLVSEKDGRYSLYSWIRSDKVVDIQNDRVVPIVNNPDNHAIAGLSHIEDTVFNRKSLQLNLYRNILKNNYNIPVSEMYLVVLHPTYSTYYCLPVPLMDKEMEWVLNHLT